MDGVSRRNASQIGWTTPSCMRLPPITRLLTHNPRGVHGEFGDRRIAMNGDEFTHCQQALIVRTMKILSDQKNYLLIVMFNLVNNLKANFFLWKMQNMFKGTHWKFEEMSELIISKYLLIKYFFFYICGEILWKLLKKNYYMYSTCLKCFIFNLF